MLPKMTSRMSGKPTPQMSPMRSRANSLSSVAVRLRRADAGTRPDSALTELDILASLVSVVTGQRDERVPQAGLLTPQLLGDDPMRGQRGGDRVDDVAGPGDQDGVPPPGQARHLGQPGAPLVAQSAALSQPRAVRSSWTA